MSTVSDQAAAFKNAMVDAAVTAIDDTDVMVCYGHPGTNLPPDIVSFGKVTCVQTPGPMSATRRSRDLTLTVEVTVSIYRGGPDPQTEKVCGDRAYALLTLLEEYLRVTDPTLGGLVWWCFLTEHESTGTTDPDLLTQGRLIEITATFTAQARITS